MTKVETIRIPKGAAPILSTSSKGDQSKWHIDGKWIKQDSRGYEGEAEVLASQLLEFSTLNQDEFVKYYSCKIILPSGEGAMGCYSYDFRSSLQEVTLERLFEANFDSTDELLNSTSLSTEEKFGSILQLIKKYTGLDARNEISRMLAFDALLLNEDRHTSNIVFLYNPLNEEWRLAPIFDNGLSLLSDTKDYPLGKPLSVLMREVKAKPFSSSFTKQLSLYKGPAFLDKRKIMDFLQTLDSTNLAARVIKSRLNDPLFQRLFISEEEPK